MSVFKSQNAQAHKQCIVVQYNIPLEFVNKSSLGYNACHIHFVLLLHLKNRDGKQPKARSKKVKSAMNIVPLYCSSWTGRLGECPLWPCYCCSLD